MAILAGGLATRLRPTTEEAPKALLEVAGQPFLAHQLQLLKASGIRKVVLCVGYRGEMIEREFDGGKLDAYSYFTGTSSNGGGTGASALDHGDGIRLAALAPWQPAGHSAGALSVG